MEGARRYGPRTSSTIDAAVALELVLVELLQQRPLFLRPEVQAQHLVAPPVPILADPRDELKSPEAHGIADN